MLEAACGVRAIAGSITFLQFDGSLLHQWGIVHGLQMIGEAASHVSEFERQGFPALPWKRVVGFRHLAVHEYFRIETEEVWRIATENIPELIEWLEAGGVTVDADDE